jgi:hypothetical protein
MAAGQHNKRRSFNCNSTPTPNEYHFITKKEIKERSALTNLVDESDVDRGCAWRRLADGG